MYKKLYGKDKTSGFKVWEINVEEVDGFGVLTILHGKEDGKMQEKVETFRAGKQGRTPYEQAILEAEARIKKNKDKNYREDKAHLTALPVLPMLAGDYNKIGKRIWERGDPVYGSDKLDGVRCMAKMQNGVVVLESRTGQPYALPHVVEELQRVMKEGEILDGEVYLHGYALQDITSVVKRTDTQAEVDKAAKKNDKHLTAESLEELREALLIHEIRPQLKFVIFDVVTDEEFKLRLVELDNVATRFADVGSSFVEVIEYYLVKDDEHLRKVLHPNAVSRGYEGVMLRTSFGLYESGKRSAWLQKFKTFMDAEFLILEVVEDKQGYAVFVLRNDLTPDTFQCVMGDLDWRIGAAADKAYFDAKWMTVQFQSRYKKTLLPQFPTGKLIREGKVVNGQFVPSE